MGGGPPTQQMGCCQSASQGEEELPPKRVVAGERSSQALRSREDLEICGDIQEAGMINTDDTREIIREEDEEKRVCTFFPRGGFFILIIFNEIK